ncbi:aldehyde dehydrogenase family protein [Nocardioides stalactiti]|uniref:aldehyde dehydrogenase family protein n=1 Tax=Nocardioides stalactiti TaxID=2755356 RepID=UPI001FE9623C|nr:aldehyde dehydrogenase family protein [Nocardioides stalactiti]
MPTSTTPSDVTRMPPGPDVLRVKNPYDGSEIGSVPALDRSATEALVARLGAAQPAWADLPVADRVRWLERYRDWVLDHRVSLAETVHLESGKVRHEALAEPVIVADLINYLCRIAPSALGDRTPAPHGMLGMSKRLRVQLRPVGVVGVISPWNFPLAMAFMDAVPALLAGCAVVTKPSEETPLSLHRAVAGWEEIGAPPVLGCATGGPDVGRAVVDTVDFIQFTGSTRTGRSVAAAAAERLVPCSLELGGKDAMIVLADADLAKAARGAAWGGMSNSGQTCVGVERVYVESAVYADFVRHLVAEVGLLEQRPDGDVGSMTTAAQLEVVRAQVGDAVARGARALTGGHPTGRGLEFAPTVLVDVDHGMEVLNEETFGPVLPVVEVRDADEAVRLANASVYGLSASVWTRDTTRFRAVADRLEVGAVNHNDVMSNLLSFAIPQSGWKASGLGARFGGPEALQKFCRPRATTEPRVALSSEPNWFPYSALRSTLTHGVLKATVARGLRRIR